MREVEAAETAAAEAVREVAEYLVRSIVTTGRGRVVVEGIPDLLGQALGALKDRRVCPDLLSLSVVDLMQEGGGLQLVHHLASQEEGVMVELWTRLSGVATEDGTPAPGPQTRGPSCARMWPAAAWLEREAWEMHGLVFDGHPGLERLLLPAWWVGHPMRRDDARNRTAFPTSPPPSTAPAPAPAAAPASVPAATPAAPPSPPTGRPAPVVPDDGWTAVGLPVVPMGGSMGLEVRARGGRVTAARVGVGLLHRGVEHLAEGRTWEGVLPLAARTAVRSSVHWQVVYALAVERLLGLTAPPRGAAIRVALMELERAADHLLSHATVLDMLGARAQAARAWADRELVLDAMQLATGGRVVHDGIVIGGVASDTAPGWEERLAAVAQLCADAAREHAEEARGLPAWGHLAGLAPVHPDHMPGWGLTGPVVRASDIERDARKDGRVPGYEMLPLKVHALGGADAQARCELRLLEVAASGSLLHALARSMPGGRVREEPAEEVPPGRTVAAVEDPRGELHCMVVSSGGEGPRRVHFRSPDLAHAAALGEMLLGVPVEDVALAVASIDICVGGVDR